MKKILGLLIACTMLCGMAACSTNSNSDSNVQATSTPTPTQAVTQAPESEPTQAADAENDTPDTQPEESGTKALVVYFSATGNTRSVAETLAQLQGADVYEIVPEQPYTAEDLNYSDRSTRATAEQNDDDARPAISGSLDNLADYDVIYVGYPIWWGDMPRILYTFFDAYDFSGKTIAPFCTSGGSGLSGTPGDIEDLEPNAEVLDGLHINDSSLSDAPEDLEEWVASLGL